MKNLLISTLLISLLIMADLLGAGDEKKDNLFSDLKFRCIGPAVFSGRISDFAVNPEKPHEYFAAVASGGVWKTVNAGITWQPVFDDQGSYSIGCIALNPCNPHEVWVGTGENNSQRSVSYGDGLYRSLDGGKSWKNMGLKKSEHIAKIIFDPRDTKVMYVASQGPLWGPGGDRGLYKSIDGGENWKVVLNISKDTGITDVVIDPRDPDVLYAASYQRRRHVWVLLNGGPESAIHKSIDGGKTWTKLTSGLPSGHVGRIGLAISPVDPDILYAIIEAQYDGSGIYMSTNRGASWVKRNKYVATSPQYYNELVADPVDAGRLYSLDTWTKISQDSGRTWKNLGNDKRHVDDHAMWIDPHNNSHILIGGDGGIYETFDNGKFWDFKENLPITQFYRVSVDSAYPFYNVYGGTQDNNSLGGPSRTINKIGITNGDWYVTYGGDGFKTQVDPTNPDIVYSQAQYGWIVRYDRKSREGMGIKPIGDWDETLKWNWDSPLLISPHNPQRLYFAANRLFRSDDRGDTWKPVSSDLTRQIDRNKLKVMGRVWSVDAVAKNNSTSFYGTIVALAESPLQEGLIYVGTDDGLIQITADGGQSWKKISRISDVPQQTYVSYITASQHDVNTVYAAFDNHKMADFKPYLLKSTDRGASWDLISSDLPKNGAVYAIAEDHVEAKLLFAGTEFGIFYSLNGGNNWRQLKNGLPTIAVKDIAIQKRENDLVLGTFGRSFYILDNYAPLREMARDRRITEKKAHIFKIKKALLYMETRWGPGSQGSTFYAAENPEFGATFTYFLKDTLRSLQDTRKQKEKDLFKQGKPVYYPSWEELSAEDIEQKPYLMFVIRDESGQIVRTLHSNPTGGIHRVTWDLRFPAYWPLKATTKEEDQASTPALPGKYNVAMYANINGQIRQMTDPREFTVESLGLGTLPAEDKAALVTFQRSVADLRRAVMGSVESVNMHQKNMADIKLAIKNSNANIEDMLNEARRIELELGDIEIALTGNSTISKRSEPVPTSIRSRLGIIVDDQWRSTSAPTTTQIASFEVVSEQFKPILSKIQKLLGNDIPALYKKMELSGAPWTPGRIPQWE